MPDVNRRNTPLLISGIFGTVKEYMREYTKKNEFKLIF